ncbi:hypothetical protein [Bradyrhizobium sp. JYMT SZCCT0428]|uniref:hypothetical protein n=1 Tax=Bradyrhizobium sp. JYMT SZCCT0428 TaxID=2807673 RepID=UPI001BAE4D9F|nr:hypothetical protein [Bradyrhizobium sp. JYMT SZCCT0428]MBR1155197.1 hypothetical protein [Bradyrhizobium sp. JYMT SZCCT0428]
MIGAVLAVTFAAGAVIFEIFTLVGPGQQPTVKDIPRLTNVGPVERSAYELPGFATGRSSEQALSFPLMRLIDPDRTFPIEGQDQPSQVPASAPPKKTLAPSVTKRIEPQADPKVAKQVEPQADPKVAKRTEPKVDSKVNKPSTSEVKTFSLESQPRLDQWRVVVTSKASYFNLGGHVGRNGVVDTLASSHLRDALKTHRNFAQLPPDIKTHILTQDINLAKIAPYRGLVGINDKTMEEEQAIRFERIASR